MKMRMAIAVGLTGVIAAAAGLAEAGTLGERMVGISVSRVEPKGDLKVADEYLDDIIGYGVSLQLPMGQYFELLANASRTNITAKYNDEGIQAKLDAPVNAFSAGARVSFLPDGPFNPFVSAIYTVAKINLEAKVNGETLLKESETEKSISVAAGAEFSINEKFSIFAAFARTRPESRDRGVDAGDAEDDRDTVTVALNYWATDRVGIGASLSQDQDTKSRTLGLNLGLKF